MRFMAVFSLADSLCYLIITLGCTALECLEMMIHHKSMKGNFSNGYLIGETQQLEVAMAESFKRRYSKSPRL
jgi:hypothetical protein